MKILIVGVPKAGKTTLAAKIGAETKFREYHTDDIIDNSRFIDHAFVVKAWFEKEGPWIIEGCIVPRALRKWLQMHTGKPCDQLFWMANPKEELSKEQTTFAKGCLKVIDEIREELIKRGVRVEER